MSPFYMNSHNTVNPMIPVILPESSFGTKSEPTKRNPLGDLSWLIGSK